MNTEYTVLAKYSTIGGDVTIKARGRFVKRDHQSQGPLCKIWIDDDSDGPWTRGTSDYIITEAELASRAAAGFIFKVSPESDRIGIAVRAASRGELVGLELRTDAEIELFSARPCYPGTYVDQNPEQSRADMLTARTELSKLA